MHSLCFRLAGLFAALSLLAFGTGSVFADQTFRVEMADFSFKPNAFTVRAGEKVTFEAVNVGQRPHDIKIEGQGVTFEVNPNGNVAAGQTMTGSTTFNTPGTYEFYCPVGNHRAQGMVASFTVTAAGAAAPAAAAAAPAGATALPRTGFPAEVVGFGSAAVSVLLLGGGLAIRRRGR